MSSSKGNILRIWQHKSISEFVVDCCGVRLHYGQSKRHRQSGSPCNFQDAFKIPLILLWLREALMGVGTTVCNPSPSISVPRRQMSWRSGSPTQFTSCQLLPESVSSNGQQYLSKIKDKRSKHLPNTQLSKHHL